MEVLLEHVQQQSLVLGFRRRAEQIVGRERRLRVSQLAWCGAGCFDSRRRVNSTVVRLHILKATLTIGILFAVSAVVGGQGANLQQNPPGIADCPTVSVSCPDDAKGNSDVHVYANVLTNVKYRWTVIWPPGIRKGRIKSGQGTPSLVISVPRRARGSLTVTVKVAGLDMACRNDASCSTMIGRN